MIAVLDALNVWHRENSSLLNNLSLALVRAAQNDAFESLPLWLVKKLVEPSARQNLVWVGRLLERAMQQKIFGIVNILFAALKPKEAALQQSQTLFKLAWSWNVVVFLRTHPKWGATHCLPLYRAHPKLLAKQIFHFKAWPLLVAIERLYCLPLLVKGTSVGVSRVTQT